MIDCSLRLLSPKGRLLAMKGAQAESEVADALMTYSNCHISVHQLPHVVEEQRKVALVKQGLE
jgi:hypothetical protein